MESESDKASSSSSLPSDEDVCRFLYGRMRRPDIYPSCVTLYTRMVEVCPPPYLEAIKKAVQKGDRKEAHNLVNLMVRGSHGSVDLYRAEAQVIFKGLTDSNGALRTDTPLRKDLLYMDVARGIMAAYKMVKLDDTDIENRYYYVTFLSLHAFDPNQRQNAIRQCQKALEIDTVFDKGNPEDPKGPRTKIKNLLEYMNERHDRIEFIWQSMINDGGFINLSFNDIDDYYANDIKDESARQVVKEALDFCISYGSWKFWQCCCCDEKFASPLLLISHFEAHVPTLHSQPQFPVVTTETLEHDGNPSTKMNSVEEPIFINPDVGSSDLFLSPTCLMNLKADSRQTYFPLRDVLISIFSYQSILGQWIDLRNSRKRMGAQLIRFLTSLKMQLEEEAKSAVETSVAQEKNAQESVAQEENSEESTEDGSLVGILKKMCTSIDSNIKATGIWSHPNIITGEEELLFTDNPFGEYDYRDVLLPILKSCIAGRVENQAEEGMRQEALNRLHRRRH